ncbi:TPA: S49 family peptidase, partial [Shigella flexneri]|nr:S49 family peptidase [Shigella flexneri]
DDEDFQERAEQQMRENLCAAYGVGRPSADKPFAFSNGLAIIPIHGTLINRYGGYYYGYVTGYNFIRSQRNAALADPDVEAIIYDVNSNGGEAAGCFELSQEMFDTRGEKPSLAVVDSNCYSAAYALASAADKIVVTPSGGAGSIGVIALHID